MNTVTVTLHSAAHGRTGDKGNTLNISVIAWHAELWPLLVEQITEELVARHFAYRRPTVVRLYLLPKLQPMNFVLEEALDGGVNSSLNLDGHGKAPSFHLLDLPLKVPVQLAAAHRERPAGAAFVTREAKKSHQATWTSRLRASDSRLVR